MHPPFFTQFLFYCQSSVFLENLASPLFSNFRRLQLPLNRGEAVQLWYNTRLYLKKEAGEVIRNCGVSKGNNVNLKQ